MIVFDLKCSYGHGFEGWFRSHDDFSSQLESGILACPDCGSTSLSKAFSTPHLSKGGAKGDPDQKDASPASRGLKARIHAPAMAFDDEERSVFKAGDLPEHVRASLDRTMGRIRKHVETTCDYVGDQFAEEARRIHYGEAELRGIYGEASLEETEDLIDEGIDVLPLSGVRDKPDA
ncbi:DUF1178 family protein [Iodidimonas gelatinilytica]|nr:DUF1178 family protein [Iodidimonas gelatinilytica]